MNVMLSDQSLVELPRGRWRAGLGDRRLTGRPLTQRCLSRALAAPRTPLSEAAKAGIRCRKGNALPVTTEQRQDKVCSLRKPVTPKFPHLNGLFYLPPLERANSRHQPVSFQQRASDDAGSAISRGQQVTGNECPPETLYAQVPLQALHLYSPVPVLECRKY